MKPEMVYEALEREFHPETCTEVFPVIGLQREYAEEIHRVYTAVFASDQVFQRLEELGAKECMLFTHHPAGQRESLLSPAPPISEYAEGVMKRQNITLFSYHIPLDRNGPYSPGNNLARKLGAVPYEEFYFQNQVRMGILCNTEYETVEETADALEKALGHPVQVYAYGDRCLQNGQIAIMAGGARSKDIYKEMKEKEVNTFITGVTNPCAPWTKDIHEEAKKNHINLIGGSHYSTERPALEAMVSFFEKLGLQAEFIPETPVMTEL